MSHCKVCATCIVAITSPPGLHGSPKTSFVSLTASNRTCLSQTSSLMSPQDSCIAIEAFVVAGSAWVSMSEAVACTPSRMRLKRVSWWIRTTCVTGCTGVRRVPAAEEFIIKKMTHIWLSAFTPNGSDGKSEYEKGHPTHADGVRSAKHASCRPGWRGSAGTP